MNNQLEEKRILVIGSKDHKLADKCVVWTETFPYLGDYDFLIINLQSLTEGVVDTINEKLGGMRADVNEIIWANTKVFCVTAPSITSSSYSDGVPFRSNYHWCPIYLYFEAKDGESFEEKRGGYFNFVKKWTHFFRDFSDKPYKVQKRENFILKIEPLLKNRARKLLAFELYFVEFNLGSGIGREKTSVDVIKSHPIIFFPPPTEISAREAVDYLLRDIRGISEIEEHVLPEWSDRVEIYNEKLIKEDIGRTTLTIKKAKKNVKKLEEKLSSILKYKALMTEGGEGRAGDRLENIVEESLQLIGVGVKPGPKAKEDRVIDDPKTKEKIPLEITGCVKSIPERKLNQLIGRLTDKRRPKKIKCRGVLIGNHYKDVPLDSKLKGRKNPFEPDVIKKAGIFDISLLPTVELFRAVNAKLKKENVSEFVKEIFNQKGLLDFNRTQKSGGE